MNARLVNIKGFSLIEALISIMVITIVALGTFEFHRYCRSFTVESNDQLRAANYARETMEDVYWQTDPQTQAQQPIPGTNFTREVTVNPGNGNQYKVVEVIVR